MADSYRKLLLRNMQKTAEKTALDSPSEIDARAFLWTFDGLNEDYELERSFSGLPGFCSSKVVDDPLPRLTEEQIKRLSTALEAILVVEAASKFDVQDPSPELQHELLTLWNHDRDDGMAPWIRNFYVSLHQDANTFWLYLQDMNGAANGIRVRNARRYANGAMGTQCGEHLSALGMANCGSRCEASFGQGQRGTINSCGRFSFVYDYHGPTTAQLGGFYRPTCIATPASNLSLRCYAGNDRCFGSKVMTPKTKLGLLELSDRPVTDALDLTFTHLAAANAQVVSQRLGLQDLPHSATEEERREQIKEFLGCSM
ncbi:hypothetical protein EDB87DRAFT_1820559 [Lactarius vividus]|nr:hypothetical protein EDB87DRAFT_1820559 [Lactarius vividus]